MMDYSGRQDQAKSYMREHKLDALITLHQPNYFYLSGFSGSSGAIVLLQDEMILLTDSRYSTQAKAETEASHCHIEIHSGTLIDALTQLLTTKAVRNIGFEANHISVAQLQSLSKSGQQFLPQFEAIEKIRSIKEAAEVRAIKHAVAIVEKVYEELLTYVQPGMTEIELAARMEMHMRTLGATAPSFGTIVASGIRGALPHGQATSKKIVAGELVTTDFGALVNGYCSDMTRTFAVGTPTSEKMVDIYNVVFEAQDAAIASIAAGKSGAEIDAIARTIIDNAGYGSYFGHGLGHAVGIEVHEKPLLRPGADDLLRAGMIVTVEPGVYLENLGGVRIEDMISVTETGYVNFMTLPKELIIV